MNRTSKIIGGIALLAFGIVWALELFGLIRISLEGWWTLFIIVPCFVNIFNDQNKTGSVIGFGIGILLLLAARDVIYWADIWKFMVCLVAVVWGISLLFFSKKSSCGHCHTESVPQDIVMDGDKMHKIDVRFCKQDYRYSGQRFEGAEVHTSFGYACLDLRNADIMDGAVISLDCNFGGIEIRVDKDVCVKTDINTTFAGVDCDCTTQQLGSAKTIYVKGQCNFGGIEIR